MYLLSNNLGKLHISGLHSGIVTSNSGNIESIEQISISQLDLQLQTQISTIDTLSSNVVNLQNEINALNTTSNNSITQLDSQLQTQISTINTLSSNVVNLQNVINALNSTSNNSITQLDSQLQTQLSTINTLSSNVVNLQNEINILNSMSNNSINLFSKLIKSSSQIVFTLNGTNYAGSGWFYAQNSSDLSKGYFITAAHCVMSITSVYNKISQAYIHHPITNDWFNINVNNIYIDGIADVALIQTNIDLTNYPEYCLKISDIETTIGQICYIIGNPGNYDEDSISVGYVRDPHYCDPAGDQITDSISITAPCIGGNSGGPIVNIYGEVIGIITFIKGTGDNFGGGSNRETLLNTLNTLKLNQDNKLKLYLGIDYRVPSAFTLKNYYSTSSFSSEGIYIDAVSLDSPFNGILQATDILLSATINSNLIKFGNVDIQRTPGVLIYYPLNTVITITYVKNNKTIMTSNVTLNKKYSDVPDLLDSFLRGALKTQVNSNIQTNLIHELTI
jgi:S1-C subfamily serine protease